MALSDYLGQLKDKTVAVIGDLMLDDYVWGKAVRISPEAPVMVLDAVRESQVPGGAANVAHNVAAMGGKALLVGVVGSDDSGRALKSCLGDLGIGSDHIVVEAGRVTTRKTRMIAHSQQVLRVDREQRGPLSEASAKDVMAAAMVAMQAADAVVLSDYRKGCLNAERVRYIVSAAKDMGKPCLANPKPHSLPWYAGADLVSINRTEAESFAGLEEATTDELISRVPERLHAAGLRFALVTLGEEGMYLCGDTSLCVPALRVEVYDTAGAGDTVIGVMALSAGAGIPWPVASRLATLAAGCVVRHVGVAVPTPGELVSLADATGYSV